MENYRFNNELSVKPLVQEAGYLAGPVWRTTPVLKITRALTPRLDMGVTRSLGETDNPARSES